LNIIRNFIKLSGINQVSWLNPLLLAIFPAVIIIWLQPIRFSPLIFELSQVNPDYVIFYEDLENDGKSERITFGNEVKEGHAHIMYYNDKDQLVGQYNSKYPKDIARGILKPYAIDVNKDGVKDLVFATMHQDSIFLEAFDYKAETGILNARFITTVGSNDTQHLDHYFNWVGHYDANNDSINELYFSVAAGFAIYPRRIFRYDFANDSLIASINTGAGDLYGKILEYNNSMQLICGSIANWNISDEYPYPYHDSTTWIFAFNKNLELVFPPKHYGTHPGGSKYPVYKDGFIYFLVGSNGAKPENKLLKMNWLGQVVDSIVFDFYVSKHFTPLKLKNKDYLLIQNLENGDFLQFDSKNFKVKKNNHFNFPSQSRILYNMDLNRDGKYELLVFNNLTNMLNIYDHKLRKQNELNTEAIVMLATSYYYDEKGYGQLVVNTENKALTFRYHENPFFNWQYPLYLGIYIVSLLFVSLILYFQNRRMQKQQQLEQQLADLQLQNLRNQLDPHFTFNVLNTIGSYIYKQDKEKAYDLFQRFTRIIRSSLLVSDKIFWSLKEEIQFTQDYLEFQKLRFKERFEYAININKNIEQDKVQFPKMLVQGFTENAVKHAFFGLDYMGLITIDVTKDEDTVTVIIEDDGIGINKSKELKKTSGTQKGLDILKEQVKQINRIYETSYYIFIQDKSQSLPEKNGTIVLIKFPFRK